MKKLFTIIALMVLSFASKAQFASVVFTQNVEPIPGNFTFILMGHNTPPPACAVTDITTPYGAIMGLPSTVNASTAAWTGPGAPWISRIKMFNMTTGGDYDQPFCLVSPGTTPIVFSDGTTYHITLTPVGGTIQVTLNP